MLKSWRLRRIRARFLESCRTLQEGKDYWESAGGAAGRLMALLSPIPVLALQQEGKGILDALEWLESQCQVKSLREAEIRHYHELACLHLGKEAGKYRTHPISVVGSAIPRAPASKVGLLMRQLDGWLCRVQEDFDKARNPPLEETLTVAVDLHQRIGLIHPFSDGNGRVARLAMNHVLRRYGFGYVILPPLSEESPLWEALQDAHRGKLAPLVLFARECLHPV